jgi:diphthine-ammonia ligase
LDCPLFVKKIVIKESEVVIHANDAFAPVAFLQLKSLSLEQKEDTSTSDTKCSQKELIEKSGVVIKGPIDFVSDIQLDEEKVTIEKVEMVSAPAILDKKECQVNVVKNWFSVQNVTSEKKDPNEATEDIFRNLKDLLNENGLAENQIVAVTLLLADMDTFQDVNKVVYMSSKIL